MDRQKGIHEQQKDCIAKDIHREMHQTARFLLIYITICVNMNHYEAIGIVRVVHKRLELPVSNKVC